jgi:site-specific DNA recombinase
MPCLVMRDDRSRALQLKAEYDRLQNRLHAMYVDKLDGRIDQSFYAQMSEKWRLEQDKLTQEIARHQTADRSFLNEGSGLIELAQGARRLFAKQEPREQRRLLNFVLSNSLWQNGELLPTFRQPFDLIAEATANAKLASGAGTQNIAEHPVWLPFVDDYRTRCIVPGPSFRLILESTIQLGLPA